MINISFSPNILLSCILAVAVIILYLLRIVRPEVARDEDLFFVTIGLTYCCILVIHGWRLDPILLFSQILIVISLLAAGWENIRLRGLLVTIIKNKNKNKNKSKNKNK